MAEQNDTITIIKQRRSVRNYLDKPVSGGDITLILEAGIYAPNGGGNIEKDMFFTVIQNKTVLDTINTQAKAFAASSGMPWLKELGNRKDFHSLYNAPVLIIISYPKDSVCAVYDCSAAAQNMLLTSESLGLGSCWLYFPLQAFQHENGDTLLHELKIPESHKPAAAIILGHKAAGETKAVKRKAENIVFIK